MTLLSKEQSRTRSAELQKLLCEWDPIGVTNSPDWPRDEYDCMAGPILRLLENGASSFEIAAYLRHEITEHFGFPQGPFKYWFVARRFRAWFDERWSGTKVAG